jgi:hypothetical protein
MNDWQVLMAVETHYEEGPVPLSASRKAFLAAMDQLRHEAVALLGEG